MADMTAKAVSQALKGASLIKLLSSLAPNQAIDKLSLAHDQDKDRDLKFQEIKNELADLHKDNLKLRAKICRLSSDTKCLQSITDNQEAEQIRSINQKERPLHDVYSSCVITTRRYFFFFS